MSRFPGVDFIEFDALLSEEERLVRDTVRAFVDDKVKPIIEECHREGRTPLELVPEMGAPQPLRRHASPTTACPASAASPTA